MRWFNNHFLEKEIRKEKILFLVYNIKIINRMMNNISQVKEAELKVKT